MNEEQALWYLEGKYYLLMNLSGIELLKKHLVNADKLFQSEIYKHELPYVMMKELGSKIKDITMMAYDEEKEDLYILVGTEQFKFSLYENGLYLNDFMIDTSTIHIPEFEEEKINIKK